MNAWISGYKNAKKAGEETGLSVVLGAEIGFDYFPQHYLCYGMDEDFFFEYPELYKMTPGEFLKLANKKGFFVCQAHPLRSGYGGLADPTLVHGMEVFNANGECFNDIVYSIAKQHKLVTTVGSDFHNPNQVAKTAVLLPRLVKNSKELAKLLRKNKIDGYVLNADNIPDVFKTDKRFICK
jgi:predicted metal-dependent phosphoesterase TrpH